MRKYWGLFKNYFAGGLEYRSNLIGLVLMQLIGVGTVLFLWLAAFRSQNSIAGFSLPQVALYYLLVPLVGFITQAQLSGQMGFEIKDGIFSNYLLKPYNIGFASLMRALGEKANQLMILLPLYFLLISAISAIWGGIGLTARGMIAAAVIAIAGFFLHFIFDLTLCWLAFWMGDIWSFQHFKTIIFGILAGVSFPFEFLPQQLRSLFEILPFKFLYYIPLSYLLNKRGFDSLAADLTQILIWGGLIFLLSIYLWKKGLKAYEAYGA
ncbi:MAG: ABC-2 family transporter protein [bacterium]|nr:ABC-2 family transporter protein [bacterium]